MAEACVKLDQSPDIVSLDPQLLSDVLNDIERIGEMTGSQVKSKEIVTGLQQRINAVTDACSAVSLRPSVFCIEWVDPIMCAGHWIPEMVEMAGGIDAFGDKTRGSFVIDWEDVKKADPDKIILMPCGFGVSRALKDLESLQERDGWSSLKAVQNQEVYVIDAGSYTSRSGPRLVIGLEMLAEIIHPELNAGLIPENSVLRLYT